MMVGYAPYEGDDQMTTFRNILRGNLAFPATMADADAVAVVKALLARDVVDRLGCRREGISEIQRHPWFAPMNFDSLVSKSLPAPWLPELAAEDDARYFETYEDDEDEVEPDDGAGDDGGTETGGGDGDGGGDDDDGDDGDVASEEADDFAVDSTLPQHLVTPMEVAAAATTAAAAAAARTRSEEAAASGLSRTNSRRSSSQPWFEGF